MTLDVRNLAFGYNGSAVLGDVSLTLRPGRMTALVGPNGTGKTTLLRCILGLEKARGEVLLDGLPLREFAGPERSRVIRYLPQTAAAHAALTVFETVLLGRLHSLALRVGESDLQATMAILEEMGLESFGSRYLDELSGGERQMVFVTQALAEEPRVLLLDEPISNLDLQNQLDILETIRRVTNERGIATLLAMHDLNLAAKFADEMIVLHSGSVRAAGTPTEVLTAEMIREVYGVVADVRAADDGLPTVTPLRSLRRRSVAADG